MVSQKTQQVSHQTSEHLTSLLSALPTIRAPVTFGVLPGSDYTIILSFTISDQTIKVPWILVRETGNTTSLTSTSHHSHPCVSSGSRSKKLSIKEHVGDIKLGKKLLEILTCWTFHQGVAWCPRSNMAVLCHTTRPGQTWPVYHSSRSDAGLALEISQLWQNRVKVGRIRVVWSWHELKS